MKKLKFIGFLTLIAILSMALGFGIFRILFRTKFVEKDTQIEIPDITKMSYNQAKAKLEALGLKIEIKREIYDSNIPEGYIVVQEPLSGMFGKANSVVKVSISKGTEDIFMPELAGMSERQARILLARNGLFVKDIAYTYSAKYQSETVITSTPRALSKVTRGMEIDLLVSLGSPKSNGYIMPNLKGKNYYSIRKILEPLGLRVGKNEVVYDEFLEDGTILDQKPPNGVMISKHENILLTISTRR